jgi:antitoxin component of RelBE/YafQ-DinJ toxin-antitoxin module
MKTSLTTKKINTLVRLDENVKRSAQKAAESINLPLSSIVNNYLYHFGQNKELAFEYPSPKLIAMLEESRKEIKKGEVSPKFKNAKDAMVWLNAQ